MNSKLNLKKSLKSNFYKIFNCVVTETAQFFSSYIFYIITAATVIYSFMGIYSLLKDKDILNMVYTNQQAQIVEIGLFLILGVQMSSKENQCKADEFMYAIYHGKFIKAISKLAALLLFCVLWYAIRCAVIVIFGIVMGTNSALILHCLAYLVLTTLFPIAIGGVLGLCIGIQIKNPAKYAAVLVVWAIISPAASTLVGFIATILSSNSDLIRYFIDMLSLGTHSFHDSASTYGFNMEFPRWIHVCIYLMMTLAYYAALNMASYKQLYISRLKSAVVPCTYVLCVIFAVMVSYNKNTSLLFDYYTYGMTISRIYDIDYYDGYYQKNGDLNLDENGIRTLNKDMLPNFSADVSLEPVSWNVNLDTSPMNMNVTASLNAVLNSKCEEQAFTLYRNFILSSVKVNGNKAGYKQEGNYFTVYIPDNINVGDSVQFDFKYEGMSSPTAPANDYMVCLPANFPWVPALGMSPLSEKSRYMNTLYSMQLVRQLNGTNEVDYKLSFKSNSDVVYTNLTQTSNNSYEGKSKMGLSVVAYPTQRVKVVNGQKIYYPLYVEDVLDTIISKANASNSIRNDVLQTLNQPIYTKNDTIAIFPQYVMPDDDFPIIDENIDLFTYNAYSKTSYYVYYNKSEQEQRESSKHDAANSIFKGTDFWDSSSEYDYINLLVPSYFEFWYFNNIDEEHYYSSSLDIDYDVEEINNEEIFSGEYKKSAIAVITKLNDMIENHEDEALQKFFSEWYAKQKSRKYSDVYEVMDMLGMEATK